MQILPEWEALPVEKWRGPIVLLGDIDTGKSTLGRYLYGRLLAHGRDVAYLDTDPGQNELGPPTTIALGTPAQSEDEFPPAGGRWLYFIGSNSPRYGRLRLISGIYHLRRLAWRQGYKTLVANTSGFVTPSYGGQAIKWTKIDLLRPCTVIALQRHGELTSLLAPLRHLPGVVVHDLPVATAVEHRSSEQRRRLRAAAYRRYFQDARRVPLSYKNLAVFPRLRFTTGQLLSLENKSGLTVALGVVQEPKPDVGIVWVYTPWPEQHRVTAVRLGKMQLSLQTYQDTPLSFDDNRQPASG